jgi:DNA-3-methyladenine glycosylase II
MYKKAKLHFKKADRVLYEASLAHTVDDVSVSKNVFYDLVHAIASQQLSGKAADTIFGRLKKLVTKGDTKFTAEKIVKMRDISLRACGFSNAKIVAIKSLANAVITGDLDVKKVHLLSDVEVIDTLTKVKGIGPWTAEMVLMFSLGREDIFSTGDLGLQKGIMYLYGLKKMPTETKIRQLSKAWAPYRTYAARVLWRVADAKKEAQRK